MHETRLYHTAFLLGVLVLLAGVALHSWKLIAVGALLAGAGGWFGMLAALPKR